MKVFCTRTRVRYAETDATGIAYYASYFLYFELGRIEMFRELGLPYDRHLPIVETYCRYHASASFDDLLLIHSFVQELRRCGFRIGSRVYRPEHRSVCVTEPELLAEGYTAMVTVGQDGRPVELPEPFVRALGSEEEDEP